MAWGEIGLKPYDYYCLTPYQFDCIVKGWMMKQAKEYAVIRKHAQIVYAAAGGKEDLQSYWPIDLIDSKVKQKRPTKAVFKKIMDDYRRKQIEKKLCLISQK